MKDRIKLSGRSAATICALAVVEFIHTGDRRGLDIARDLRYKNGDRVPIDEMISYVLVESGRLLTAGTPPVPAPRLMDWKCTHCGHKWLDRSDGENAKFGCPNCGSHNIFDCNVKFIGFITPRRPA